MEEETTTVIKMGKGTIASPGTSRKGNHSRGNRSNNEKLPRDDHTETTTDETSVSSSAGGASVSSELDGSKRSPGKKNNKSSKSDNPKAKSKDDKASKVKSPKSSHSKHQQKEEKDKKQEKAKKEDGNDHRDNKDRHHHHHHHHYHEKDSTAKDEGKEVEPNYRWETHHSTGGHHHQQQPSPKQRRKSEAEVLDILKPRSNHAKEHRHSLKQIKKSERHFQKLIHGEDDDDGGAVDDSDFFYADNGENSDVEQSGHVYRSPHQQQHKMVVGGRAEGGAGFGLEEDDAFDEEEQDMEEDEALRTSMSQTSLTDPNKNKSLGCAPRRPSTEFSPLPHRPFSRGFGSGPSSANPSFIPSYLADASNSSNFDGDDNEELDELAEQVIQNPSTAYAHHSPTKYRGGPGSPYAEKPTIGPEVLPGGEDFTPEAMGLDEGIPEINEKLYTSLR